MDDQYLNYWKKMTLDAAEVRGFADFGHGGVIHSGGLFVIVSNPGNKHGIGTVHPHDVNGTSEKLHKVIFAGTKEEVLSYLKEHDCSHS